MIKTILISTLLFSTGVAFADSQAVCNYSEGQAPLATITLTLDANGVPGPTAQYTMQGGGGQEPVTLVPLGTNEKIHIWLDQADPDNAVEMIAYIQPTSDGESVLINHNMPFLQDIWGSCSFN
jgi:hypothetical protein